MTVVHGIAKWLLLMGFCFSCTGGPLHADEGKDLGKRVLELRSLDCHLVIEAVGILYREGECSLPYLLENIADETTFHGKVLLGPVSDGDVTYHPTDYVFSERVTYVGEACLYLIIAILRQDIAFASENKTAHPHPQRQLKSLKRELLKMWKMHLRGIGDLDANTVEQAAKRHGLVFPLIS